MLRWLARVSFIRRVNGADNSQRAHVSLSGKLKSDAAAAIPRSRSPRRSGGKYSPIRAATSSLRLDDKESGRVVCTARLTGSPMRDPEDVLLPAKEICRGRRWGSGHLPVL